MTRQGIRHRAMIALYALGALGFIAGTVLLFAAYAPPSDQLESIGQFSLCGSWGVLVAAAILDVIGRRRSPSSSAVDG